jgi:hypothetical protein
MDRNVKEFIDTWEGLIPKIENRPIDSHGTHMIYINFHRDMTWLKIFLTEQENEQYYEVFHNLEAKVTIALHSARSLYQLQNRGIWARIIENITALTINKLPTKP